MRLFGCRTSLFTHRHSTGGPEQGEQENGPSFRPLDLLKSSGSSLIAGASDTDPTTVATMAVIGATTVYGLSWLAILIFPILAVIQAISARIGVVTHEVLQYLVKRRFGRWSQMDARNSSLMGEVPAKAKPVPSAIATAATAEKAGARRGFSERPRGQSNSAPTNIGGGGEQDGQRQQCRPEQADPKEVPGVPARHRDQRLCCVLAVRGALKAAGWAVVLGVSLVSVVYLVQQVTGGG